VTNFLGIFTYFSLTRWIELDFLGTMTFGTSERSIFARWITRRPKRLEAGMLCCLGLVISELNASPSERAIVEAFDHPVSQVDSGSREVSWSYVNHWDFPLVIDQFEESCACLRPTGEVESVKPGESGVIRAAFDVGIQRGLIRKSLHVRFAGHEGAVELVAEALVPLGVELSTHELVWSEGVTGALFVDVTAGTDESFQITALRGVQATEFEIQTETVAAGRHYRLTVKPGPSAPKGVARCLQIQTDSADPRDRIVAVFLRAGNGSEHSSSEAAALNDLAPSAGNAPEAP